MFATGVRTSEAEILTKKIDEQLSRFAAPDAALAVDGQLNFDG